MKTFEVITSYIDEELKIPYSNIRNSYYIKDNKICFKVKKYKIYKKHIVNCFHKNSIFIFEKYQNKIESINFIKNFYSKFDKLENTNLGKKWIRFENEYEIKKEYLGEFDKPCSHSVQKEYKKLGYIPPIKYSEF